MSRLKWVASPPSRGLKGIKKAAFRHHDGGGFFDVLRLVSWWADLFMARGILEERARALIKPGCSLCASVTFFGRSRGTIWHKRKTVPQSLRHDCCFCHVVVALLSRSCHACWSGSRYHIDVQIIFLTRSNDFSRSGPERLKSLLRIPNLFLNIYTFGPPDRYAL